MAKVRDTGKNKGGKGARNANMNKDFKNYGNQMKEGGAEEYESLRPDQEKANNKYLSSRW